MHKHVLSKGTKSPTKDPREHLLRKDSMSNFLQREDPRLILKRKTVDRIEQGISEMQKNTKFGDVELKDIFERYHAETVNNAGRMTLEQFSNVMRDMLDLDDMVIAQYYKQFDADENGTVDFREFVSGLGILLKGSAEEKLKFIFKTYDLDGNGFIDRDEMKHWLKSMFVTGVNVLQELLNNMNIHVTEERSNYADLIEQIVDKCFIVVDRERTGLISEKDFLDWCQQQPAIMNLLTEQKL